MRQSRYHARVPAGIAAAMLMAALPGQAGANELYYRVDLGFDAFHPADDIVYTTELTDTSPTGSLGTAITGIAPIPYHLDQNNFFPADASVIGGGLVSYGYIRGVVGGTSSSAGQGITATSVFRGSYTDSMTVMPANPALMGTQGTMIGTVMVHVATPVLNTLGTTDFVGSLESQVSLQWILQGGGQSANSTTYTFAAGTWEATDEVAAAGGYDIQDFGTGLGGHFSADGVNSVLVPVQIDFLWGTPFDTGLELQATALVEGTSFGGQNSASAEGLLDFLNTVNWQGIQSIRDSQGNLVTDYTVSAASGTDYTQAVVPAPGALLLMVTALGGLVTRMRSVASGQRRS